MKWILFTGTWRLTNEEVEKDVRQAVREIIARGDGVLTGGATGVDYFAMDECLRLGALNKLRIFLPAKLEWFIKDYYDNWQHEPITEKDIDKLAELLRHIKEAIPTGLLEMPNEIITQADYDDRHDEEVRYSDEVQAFQVNESKGTQDTIDKALDAGLPIKVHKKYTI
jgi:antirestriction protein